MLYIYLQAFTTRLQVKFYVQNQANDLAIKYEVKVCKDDTLAKHSLTGRI